MYVKVTEHSEPARQNYAIRDAKMAYGIFAHRTGMTTPFERLPAAEVQAWVEVVEFARSLRKL